MFVQICVLCQVVYEEFGSLFLSSPVLLLSFSLPSSFFPLPSFFLPFLLLSSPLPTYFIPPPFFFLPPLFFFPPPSYPPFLKSSHPFPFLPCKRWVSLMRQDKILEIDYLLMNSNKFQWLLNISSVPASRDF